MSSLRTVFCAVLMTAATTVNAAPAAIDGHLGLMGNVALIPLVLDADARNVRIFTDSYANRTYFDPAIAMWDSTGHLIGFNNDRKRGFPLSGMMSSRDAGLLLDLAAGTYTIGVMHGTNRPFNDELSDGFSPSFNLMEIGQKDYWRLNATDGCFGMPAFTMTSPVPEPSGLLLLASGLGLTGLLGWRRRRGDATTWTA